MSILICPHCKLPLRITENNSYGCENNHQFDIAKEGYVNLLPANQKKSKNPGDSELMIAARRSFLAEGHYDPLVNAISSVIEDFIKKESSFTLLDTGCGEGYYTNRILEKGQSDALKVFGTDISKYAVRLAAKRYKSVDFFVSSIFNLPVLDTSVDLIVSIFAPFQAEEFQRILTSNGALLIVSPAENHMKEIAELVYDEFRPHERTILDKIPDAFVKVKAERCSFKLELTDNESLVNLLKMTPYYWSASEKQVAYFETIEKIHVSCDFNLTLFQVVV